MGAVVVVYELKGPLVCVYAYVGTVQYGPLQTLVNVFIYARGLYGESLVNICHSFIHFTRSLHFVS